TALSYREKELVEHSIHHHSDGFGTPIGKLKGINLAIEDMGPRDLKAYNIYEGEIVTLEFDGGIKVSGEIITGTRNLQGKILLITFQNCTVSHHGKIIFDSKNGVYNMAIGQEVISAFNGPADVNSFNLATHQTSKSDTVTQKRKRTEKLERLYLQARDYREGRNTTISRNKVFQEIKSNFPKDWLLPVELYELAKRNQDEDFAHEIKAHLEKVKQDNPKVGHLIDDGLGLANKKIQV